MNNALNTFNEINTALNYGYTKGETNIGEIQIRILDLADRLSILVERLRANLITDDRVYGKPANLAIVGDYYAQMNEMQKQQSMNQGMTR